jgi:hypothetical protein
LDTNFVMLPDLNSDSVIPSSMAILFARDARSDTFKDNLNVCAHSPRIKETRENLLGMQVSWYRPRMRSVTSVMDAMW